jgi:hypothetical protein
MGVIRVTVTRSGGFGGMTQTASVDSAELSSADAAELSARIDAARFFELPTELGGSVAERDAFRYDVTVEEAERRHVVHAGDSSATESLLELVAFVREHG